MSDQTTPPILTEEPIELVDKITAAWSKYGKPIGIGIAAVLLAVGGYLGYKQLVTEPNEKKAAEAIFKAQDYFATDSLTLALNGDNLGNSGFLKIISKYSGTKAANLSHFYAGYIYLTLADFKNAEKHLKDFSPTTPLINARAKCLLGDVYSEQNKKEEAIKLYKEAGNLVEKDDYYSPQYLSRAAFLYETMGKPKEAAAVFKTIQEKYPNFKEIDVEKYLGKMGVLED
jgi:tetratricopeptide (TPR) repeat protein